MIEISFDISQPVNLIEKNSINSLYDVMTSFRSSLETMPKAGTQYASVYDTAYLSLIKDSSNRPIFTNSLKYLFQSMHKDYSWGNQAILSDSILSTLASIHALQHSHLTSVPYVQNIIQKASDFIYDKYFFISSEPFFTAGFEFLVPDLIQKTGLYLDDHPVTKTMIKYQQKKLSMLPLEYIEKKKTPMLFALESLEEQGIKKDLDHFIEQNGSIATSPSTTAWYINHNENSEKLTEMMTYLSSVYNGKDGSVPSFADYSLMNIPFVLYPLMKANIVLQDTFQLLQYVLNNWTPSGVGHSAFFPMTDADDTAVSLMLFNKYNLLAPEDERNKSIKAYYRENYFVTYPWEIGASNMVNLHVLDMYLESSIKDPARNLIVDQLVSFIAKQFTNEQGIGGDKYHSSPYCQNAHAVLTLSKHYPDLSRKLVDWFLAQQDENGLWGIHGPTVEETAYAVMALSYYHIHAENIDLDPLYKAIDYLLQNDRPYPDLWLSKVAYTPIETVKAHVLAALELYRKAVN